MTLQEEMRHNLMNLELCLFEEDDGKAAVLEYPPIRKEPNFRMAYAMIGRLRDNIQYKVKG